jgi:hypothetical protein
MPEITYVDAVIGVAMIFLASVLGLLTWFYSK